MNDARKKVVVTGGGGFVGSHLTTALVAEGYDVHVVDTFTSPKQEVRINADATYHEVDVRNKEMLAPIFEGAMYVFHAAALPSVQYSIDFPTESHSVNIDGTLAVLEAAREAKVRRVVFMASAAYYGNQDVMPLVETMSARPMSPYALHKHVGEQMCRMWSEIYSVQTVALRCFNIYGPHMNTQGAYASAIGIFLTQRKEGKPLTITGDGTQTRDYVHVSDVARANILAAETESVGQGEVINIGSGMRVSINELAQMVGGDVTYLPPWLEPHDSVADVARAHELLDWEPTVKLENGIAELKKLAGIE